MLQALLFKRQEYLTRHLKADLLGSLISLGLLARVEGSAFGKL